MLDHDVQYRLDHHADLSLAADVRHDRGDRRRRVGGRGDAGWSPRRPTTSRCTRRSGTASKAEDKVVALAGDTIPCEGLDRLCAGADVYVQTGGAARPRYAPTVGVPSPRFQDILDYHSSCEDAGRTGTGAGRREDARAHASGAAAGSRHRGRVGRAGGHRVRRRDRPRPRPLVDHALTARTGRSEVVVVQQVVRREPAGDGGDEVRDELVGEHGGDGDLGGDAGRGQRTAHADGRHRGPATGDRDE